MAPAAQKVAQKKATEAAAQAKDVRRRNGLLCFSDMIISPPTYTARMFSRRKHTNINVKVEYMSDEEDKFVDEVYFLSQKNYFLKVLSVVTYLVNVLGH